MNFISEWTIIEIQAVVRVIGELDPMPEIFSGLPTKRFFNRSAHGLVYNRSGLRRYTIKGFPAIDCPPGTLLYLPEDCDYMAQILDIGDCDCVNFRIQPAAPLPPFLLTPRRVKDCERRFTEMTRLWTFRPVAYAAHLNALLYETLADIDEDQSARYLPEKYTGVMRACVSRIENDLTGEWPIAALAHECGMSETYFRRLFREVYGLSPKQYIARARLRQACALLENTDTPIAAIGESVGFDSPYHFSRAFRSQEGVSPSEYRLFSLKRR